MLTKRVLLAAAATMAASWALSAEPDMAKFAGQFGPTVMYVPRPAQGPQIDGKLDEAAWAAAKPVELGFLTGRWEKPSQKTEARVLADDKAIYFALKCFEAEPERVIAAGKARDDDVIWNGDTVELFLDPGHQHKRGKYVHIIINPAALVYDEKDGDKKWNCQAAVATGKFEGGWTVEAAVPVKDLAEEGVAKVWGLNINRQRPELGEQKPAGVGLTSTAIKVVDPAKYREGEDTAWAPTWCNSSHIVQRFGHAMLEAGSVEVEAPEKLFEIIYKSNFDDGKLGPWFNAELTDSDNFRDPGKCLAPKAGENNGACGLGVSLRDLDDVTLIMAMRMPNDGRFYYYGRTPDNEQAEADRHEVFMTKEAAGARKFPERDTYDTHSDKMAWKTQGRLWKAPNDWAMMTGEFGEASIGSVISPGKDWVVLRTQLSQFRRQRSQALVGLAMNYTRGLTFSGGPDTRIDNVVIFRGFDMEPPARVEELKLAKLEGQIEVSWKPAEDNTFTAYYRIMADGQLVGETHQLSMKLPLAKVSGKAITVQPCDFYGNVSDNSKPLPVK